MANALKHVENAIYHFQFVKKLLNSNFEILEAIKKKSIKVIDIGCGTGRVLVEEVVPALPKDFSEVVGIDIQESMIDYCKTQKVDSRISFQQLDISTKILPKNLEGRFDLATSFFCLHYIRNYNQMLQNVHKLLKPNGELFFIQVRVNPLYQTYRELSRIDRWKPHFKDFETYTDHFSGEDPEAELEQVCQKNNMKLCSCLLTVPEFNMISRNFIDSLKALDFLGRAIPENEKEDYTKDFHKYFSKISDYDFVTDESLNNEMANTFDMLTVHAKKCP